mgnify:FL=1
MLHRLEVAYVPTPLEPRLTVGELISFHYYQYAPTYTGLIEEHDFWEMVYADSGRIICNAGGKEVKLAQGHAIFHPPMEEHSVVALGSSGNACILSFTSAELDPQMFRGVVVPFSKQQRDLVSEIYAEGRKLFEPPYNAFVQARLKLRENAPFASGQMIRNMLENLLILITRDLMRNHAAPEPDAEGRLPAYRRTHYNAEEIAQKVAEHLEKHMGEKLSMRDICAEMAFSDGHLQNIFKKQTGQSIIHYFNTMKMECAKKLICEGQYTFTQIGGMLGFSSIHYFSRVFKAHVHMSPSEYEKSVRMSAMR